ncbi:MAG: Gldg family protein [Deltaproteobacteria bacterium]|nr:Gldg family protein [Deltaproteobacteria bacterium]
MRESLLVGFVALAFGLAAHQLQGEMSLFSAANLVLAAAALLAAAVLAARGLGRARRALQLHTVARAALVILATLAAAVAAERLAASSQLRMDLTFEGRYEIAPATRKAAAELSQPARMTLYFDIGDPRIRRTYLLLEEITRGSAIELRKRDLAEHPEDEDRFGIGTSNTVVIETPEDWRSVERPEEGAIFEALAVLGGEGRGVVYITTGTGEGDVDIGSSVGFSGYAVALQTEGYEVRLLPGSVMDEIPGDADAVVIIRPARGMRPAALDALRRYLAEGGSLVAFIEPASDSGLEAVLAEFGLVSPDAFVIDPPSGAVDGGPPGASPIATAYADHPVTRGLDSNRATFFRGARSFVLDKPAPRDKLAAAVFASNQSWLHPPDLNLSSRVEPTRPWDARNDYHPLVVTGRYMRGEAGAERQSRIVAFGDSDFASNRYLRTLFNLDLAMNAVHWAVHRESEITLRPKGAGVTQFPLPVQSSLGAFYGVGLLVPELLILVGGVVWLRSRGA